VAHVQSVSFEEARNKQPLGFSPLSAKEGEVEYEELYAGASWKFSKPTPSSHMIKALAYDPENQWMRVEFQVNDDICIFNNVDSTVYWDLVQKYERDGSIGSMFWDLVRWRGQRENAKYPFWYENKGTWAYVPEWAAEKYGKSNIAVRDAIRALPPGHEDRVRYEIEVKAGEKGGTYRGTDEQQSDKARKYLEQAYGAEVSPPAPKEAKPIKDADIKKRARAKGISLEEAKIELETEAQQAKHAGSYSNQLTDRLEQNKQDLLDKGASVGKKIFGLSEKQLLWMENEGKAAKLWKRQSGGPGNLATITFPEGWKRDQHGHIVDKQGRIVTIKELATLWARQSQLNEQGDIVNQDISSLPQFGGEVEDGSIK